MYYQEDNDDEKSANNSIQIKLKTPFFMRLSIVALVYTLQGASLEFLQYSVQTELVFHGATNSQLAILSTMEYPWCFKFLWAPLQDSFFVASLGRRKTWVFGSSIILAILWGYYAFEIQSMITNLEVTIVAVSGIFTSIFLTIQDVSMDGWIVKLSNNEKELSMFSWWISFGWSLGALLSFTLYMWLSSDEWCNYYLGTDHLLTSQGLVAVISICFLIVSFFILFMPEEKDSMEIACQQKLSQNHIELQQQVKINNYNNFDQVQEDPKNSPQESSQMTNFKRVVEKIKNVLYNRNIQFLACYLLFSEVGLTYFDNVGYVEMLNHGISATTLALFWLIATIFEGITGYTVTKYCYGSQLKIYLMSFVVRTLNGVFYSFIIYGINTNQFSQLTIVMLFGLQQCVGEIGYSMNTVPLLNFFLSICDTEVEGTYLAILTSVLYSAPIWTATVIFTLSDHIGAVYLITFSLIWNVIYMGVFGRRFLQLQLLDKDQWAFRYESLTNLDVELKQRKNSVEQQVDAQQVQIP